jgi:hypothetical protein
LPSWREAIFVFLQIQKMQKCTKQSGKQCKVLSLCSFLHFLLRVNLQNGLPRKSPWYPLTSISIGSKGSETTWQAVESGTAFLIFENPPFGHFLKMACR